MLSALLPRVAWNNGRDCCLKALPAPPFVVSTLQSAVLFVASALRMTTVLSPRRSSLFVYSVTSRHFELLSRRGLMVILLLSLLYLMLICFASHAFAGGRPVASELLLIRTCRRLMRNSQYCLPATVFLLPRD
jgi:hypothetical protein